MRNPLTLACLFLSAAASSAEWRPVGPPGGMVVSLAAGPDATIYLGTPDGHLFASSDRGEHWQLRGRAGSRPDAVVQRLAPDRARRDRLLAAVWFQQAEGGGLFESLDGGRVWKPAGLVGEAVRVIEQSPSDPRTWAAGTRSGVFLTRDDARSWQRISREGDGELANVDSVALDPEDPRVLYVGTYHLPWKTTDAGATWTPIGTGMIDDSDVMSLRIDARDPSRIFASACSGIYRTDNGGASWTKLAGIPYSSRRTQQIVQDPGNPEVLYAATTEGLWATADHGETWKRIGPRGADANAVVLLPAERGDRLLLGTDAGVLRSDDRGSSFAPANQGFAHAVIAAFAADPRDARHLLVRRSDSGRLEESRDAGESWSELPRPRGGRAVAALFASASGWWASFGEGGLARFDPAARSWRPVPFRAPPAWSARGRPARKRPANAAPRVSALVERPGETIAASDDGLWRRAGGAAEFRRLDAGGLPKSVAFLCASEEGLLAIAGGQLWGRAGTGPWNRLPAPGDGDGLRWVAERSLDGRTVRLAGTSNGVFRWDGRAWQPAAGGLPAIDSLPPAFSGRGAAIAMSNGALYRSGAGLGDWQRLAGAEGSVAAVAFLEDDALLVVSRSEGLLRAGPGTEK